jgi:hypothetical protein
MQKKASLDGSFFRRALCGERVQMKALLDDEIPFPAE